MKKNIFTPLSGFRDFLKEDAFLREYVIEKISEVFKSFGFEVLYTPSIERKEILEGKYGEEAEKLIYDVFLSGEYKGGLRYDLTVSLARVYSLNYHNVKLPYCRYEIGKVWRGERAQVGKGRLREFTQADIDILGADTPESDFYIINVGIKALLNLGFKKEDIKIYLNSRKIMNFLMEKLFSVDKEKVLGVFQTIDKLDKFKKEFVLNELVAKRELKKEVAEKILNFVDVEFDFSNYFVFLENLNIDDEELNKEVNRIGFILKNFKDLGIFSVWKLNLVRGLDYYDGLVFETFIEGSSVGAVFSGGRYNSLVRVFLGKEIPAFGGSIGIERVIDVLKEKGISKKILKKYGERYFIAYLDLDFSEYLKIADVLRGRGYKVFVYPKKDKLKKQLSYASSYNFKYAVFYGKSEKDKGVIKVKDMETGEEFFEKI